MHKITAENFYKQDIISLDQFTTESLELLFQNSRQLKDGVWGRHHNALLNKLVTILFFEPSSRSFGSFASAVKRLGGQTIEYQNPGENSSAVKGESIEDTARVFACYADALIVRHKEAGAVQRFADAVDIPVINAGDGSGEHPTQALYDLFTIKESVGRLSGLTGVIAGDLLYGRTVHSLLKGLALYPKNNMYLLAPESLRLPMDVVSDLQSRGLGITIINATAEMPEAADFWYWTRIQKERFLREEEADVVKLSFVLDKQLVEAKAGPHTCFLHPLPRIGEIDPMLDSDPRALYLPTQVQNGLYVRMALLSLVLGA
jgi:aspartate carbamoyltransferase catalytic subunit